MATDFKVGDVVQTGVSGVTIERKPDGWVWSDDVESGATDDEIRGWVEFGTAWVVAPPA
jgi:hypothetical protein